MLKFKIQIANGSLIDIYEPIGFDKVDFNLTRSESLHSISSSFAGNSIEFEFVHNYHMNVFESIINEYEVKGFNANVVLYVYWDDVEIFNGMFDFSSSTTDMVTYLKCQVVKKDKLYYLDKNKDVDVDIFSNKDLYDNDVLPAENDFVALPPVTLKHESIWEDLKNEDYLFTGQRSFNNAQNIILEEIQDTLSWMTIAEPWDSGNAYYGRNHQLISSKQNLSNIKIKIEYEEGTSLIPIGGTQNAKLMIVYGAERPDLNNLDWYNQTQKMTVADITFTTEAFLPSITEITIDSIPRGSGLWIFWYRGIGPNVTFRNRGTKITITADSKAFYSITNSVKYKEVVNQTVKRIAGINNVQWNVNYYDETFAFNGDLLRYINDRGFKFKWKDIASQLDERNLGAYYNETTDTLVIDSRSNILGNNNIILIGDLAKKDSYLVTEDPKFIVNKFGYKYNKFQALKENSVNGNYSSVHGESEWFIDNKGFEGAIQVDLPYVRDSFMVEDIRIKALAYEKDTATNEDDTVLLIECYFNPLFDEVITETIIVETAFDSNTNTQTIRNDGTFSWINIGLAGGADYIEVNGFPYYTSAELDHTQINLIRGVGNTQVLNGTQTITISYTLKVNYIGLINNGLLNQSFSVRQNIEYWRATLQATNYYTGLPIKNSSYKENKNASINGLYEDADIIPYGGLHSSRFIETKVVMKVNNYFTLRDNKVGYISIYNAKNELINIYITELKAVFLNGCDMMEADIKGWLKI